MHHNIGLVEKHNKRHSEERNDVAISLVFNIRDCHAVARNDENSTFSTGPIGEGFFMAGEIFEVSLWFNSGKSAKQRQLTNSTKNSGVGINILKAGQKYFRTNSKTVVLCFDDGTHGTATVDKCSWGSCMHLIDSCIGKWARNNGLWRRKLRSGRVSVRFSMKVIKNFTVYNVSK